jgi:hypothetical protein
LVSVIDDRAGPNPAAWRFFTDAVMGGVSTGGMSEVTVKGRAALCLRGQVRLDNQGGFIQMALDLPPGAATAGWNAIEIDVSGNGQCYGLHLRTAGMSMPWQSFRSTFEAGPTWQTVRLPLAGFEPYRCSGVLRAADVRRVGLLAIGRRMEAELCVARVAWAA